MAGGPETLNKALQKLLQAVKPLGGATTATEALENLGAMGKWELLWENASPTSSFATQTISVANATDYDFVLVVYHGEQATIVPRTETINVVAFTLASSASVTIHTRSCWFSTGVGFGGNYKKVVTSNTAGSLDNTVLIPLKICGLRNVIKEVA